MRRALCLLALAACGGDDAAVGSGTLAYIEPGTGHVRATDLATGGDTLVDGGTFGAITIAPDGGHVAYLGTDQVMKIAALDGGGAIVPLSPSGGCGGPATWLSSTALEYCISARGMSGWVLAPALDGTQDRFLDVFASAVTPDGAHLAVVDNQGNIAIENLDGSAPRQLVPSPDPTAMYPDEYVTAFTPDGRTMLVEDERAAPVLHLIDTASGAAIDVPDVRFGGAPFGGRIIGASPFSPDGREVVMESSTALVAVDVTSGATRTLATFPDRVSSAGAVWLDAERVLWIRYEDHSVGDSGAFVLSLHIQTADGDVVIVPPVPGNPDWSTIAVSPRGFVALPGDIVVADFTGGAITKVPAGGSPITDILGITADGRGVVAIDDAGNVRLFDEDGGGRIVGAAGPPRPDQGTTEPWAAFAP